MAKSIEELRAEESKTLEWLQAAERVLMMVDHAKHPQGEAWFAGLARYQARVEALRGIRQELLDAGQQVARCAICGSIVTIGSEVRVGCEDCGHCGFEDRLSDVLAGQGWAVGVIGGEQVLILRAGDTSAPDRLAGVPRITIGELAAAVGMPSDHRGALIDIKSVFGGARLVDAA